MDASGNACPSLHVAYAVFTACWLHRQLLDFKAGRLPRLLNYLWCAAIIHSTMAIHQHVAWDVLAGALLGGAVVWPHLLWTKPSPQTFMSGACSSGRSEHLLVGRDSA
jgi:membrane-associated phospholipid phosphatase